MGKGLLVSLLLTGALLQAATIEWIEKFPTATFKAQESKKPILFVVTTHKNDITKKIEKDSFAVEMIKNRFIPVVSYKDSSGFIPRSIYKPTAPSIWFLQPTGTIMYKQSSYEGHVLLEDLDTALTIVNRDVLNRLEYERMSKLPYVLDVDFPYYTNLQEAEKASAKSKKPIFLLVGRNTCKYCVKLKKEVLVEPSVMKRLEKEFVVLVLDANKPVPYAYRTPGIPAVWFLDSEGKPFGSPLVGFVPKEKLTAKMSQVKQELKK